MSLNLVRVSTNRVYAWMYFIYFMRKEDFVWAFAESVMACKDTFRPTVSWSDLCKLTLTFCGWLFYCLLEKARPIETILAHKVGLSKRVCLHETTTLGVMVSTSPKGGMRSTRQALSQEPVTPVRKRRWSTNHFLQVRAPMNAVFLLLLLVGDVENNLGPSWYACGQNLRWFDTPLASFMPAYEAQTYNQANCSCVPR